MPSSRKKVKFNGLKAELTGVLTKPAIEPKAYVLYAHCFTCGKNFRASSRMSSALVKLGYAVFRFDFTGLGESAGDFADTNFSTNVDDLITAANFMRTYYQAPTLLIGHSLGGTAIIKAAAAIEEAKAVVCMSSPAHANHIAHIFANHIDEIQQFGQAQIKLAGRDFTIKKQFLHDLDNQSTSHLRTLDKALLVMHSPVDKVVAIEEAEKIYSKAKHPKSFVSLDDADHLLSKAADIQYAAAVIDSWSRRFL